MFKHRVRTASLGLLVLVLLAIGCHSVPLGDPEKSVVDPTLAGWWLDDKSENSRLLAYIMPYDARTYVVTAYSYKTKGDGVKNEFKLTNKAWLTTVGGMEVMTLKIIDPEWDLEGGSDVNSRYVYYRVRKPGPGLLEVTPLNIDFLKDTKTPDELAKKIADNVNNAELWKGSDPILLKLIPDSRKEEVKKIVKAFEPGKSNL